MVVAVVVMVGSGACLEEKSLSSAQRITAQCTKILQIDLLVHSQTFSCQTNGFLHK